MTTRRYAIATIALLAAGCSPPPHEPTPIIELEQRESRWRGEARLDADGFGKVATNAPSTASCSASATSSATVTWSAHPLTWEGSVYGKPHDTLRWACVDRWTEPKVKP